MISDWKFVTIVPKEGHSYLTKYELRHENLEWKMAGPVVKGFGDLTDQLWRDYKLPDDVPPNSFKGIAHSPVPKEAILDLFPNATIDGEWVYLTDTDMAMVVLAAS